MESEAGAEEDGPGRAEGGARRRAVGVEGEAPVSGRVTAASWESGGGVGGLVEVYTDGIWERGSGGGGGGSGLGFPPRSLYTVFPLDCGMNIKKGRGFSAKRDRTNL
jgi:hypothetical protein